MRSAAPRGAKAPYPTVLAGIGHGSHVCAFYETKDDLLDLVLPFFAAGLARNELCVWMTPDSISEDEARIRAREAVAERGLEIRPARELYLKRRRFQRDPVLRFWNEKLQQALTSHRCGLHASGDSFWLQRNDWDAFLVYETDVSTMIADKPITLLCTYPFSLSKVGDVFDVARAHQFAVAMRRHKWEILAPPAVDPDRRAEAVDAAARVSRLTPRERQVLDAVIDGRPNKLIAHDLGLEVRTIEAHRARLMRRLGVRTMVEAVRLGTLARLVSPSPPFSTQ